MAKLDPNTSEAVAVKALQDGRCDATEFSEWLAATRRPSGWMPIPPALEVSKAGHVHLKKVQHPIFGLTLSPDSFEYVVANQDTIRSFIAANKDEMAARRAASKAEAKSKAQADKLNA